MFSKATLDRILEHEVRIDHKVDVRKFKKDLKKSICDRFGLYTMSELQDRKDLHPEVVQMFKDAVKKEFGIDLE
jgi:hypothetical protein